MYKVQHQNYENASSIRFVIAAVHNTGPSHPKKTAEN